MNSLISVIVPVYKVEQYLDKCIKSIVNQTYENLEIILVDDGSPDNCPVMCDEWAKKDSRIKVIHKANAGVSAARNSGIEVMSGEYCCFVDSDDYLDKEMLEIMLSNIINSECDVCVCNINVLDRNYGFIEKSHYLCGYYEGNDVFENYLKRTPYGVSPCNKLYKSSIIKDNGLFFNRDIKVAEDMLFNYFFFKHSQKAVVIDDALYFYLSEREGSCMNSVSSTVINRWKITKYMLLQEKNNEKDKNIILNIYAYELLCVIKELLRANDTDLINECYNEIVKEISVHRKAFLKLDISKFSKFSIIVLSLFPTLFKRFYCLYNKVKK